MDGSEFLPDSHVAPQKYSYIELDSVLIIMYNDQKCILFANMNIVYRF